MTSAYVRCSARADYAKSIRLLRDRSLQSFPRAWLQLKGRAEKLMDATAPCRRDSRQSEHSSIAAIRLTGLSSIQQADRVGSGSPAVTS